MKLNIRGKDMKITEAMKNYADEKFTKLEKYLKKDSKSGYSKVYDSLVKDSQKIITEYFVIYNKV